MEESIPYLNETLWPGRIGHAGIILAFVAALMGVVAYYFAAQREDAPEGATWKRMGRWAFGAHAFGVLTVIGILFYAMINQLYEYQYVWAHVSADLPMKYIFSAFWEGQEGSFLLWMFWHVVLGGLLIWSAKRWEAPVLAVLLLIELFIVTMILGIYFGDLRIGSNPTLLLRDVMDAPIFANADYLSLIQGSGLNPLLQNYWMTIHPPTLFLGFASTAVPFAFAVAGLWKRDYEGWIKPALPWALFSGMILGTGILMGGAWAYEALSFGGYWAWDPVENMSLVPWLTLIAGIHTHLVAKSTGYSIRSTFAFYMLSFVLILYSTFMTRSGVLGETSAHAFTEMGLEWQLVAFVGFFAVLSVVLWAMRYGAVPAPKKEEALASKEFWLFIGSLVLLFSAVLITTSTSLPVYNKIAEYFNPAYVGRVITDPIPHYNKYQLWIGIFIGLLSGGAQFLRFREMNWPGQWRKFALHAGIALAAAGLMTWVTTLWINAYAWQYVLLLFAGWFTLISNLDYLLFFLRGKLKVAGSVFAHIGFGMMIIGILASGLNKRFVSINTFVMDGLMEGADPERLKNNILLFKGVPMMMGGYEVTYRSDTLENVTRTYTVNYQRRNEEGRLVENFNLYPNILYDKSFKKIAASNPDTKQYWHKDIFTHISNLPAVEIDMDLRKQREDSLTYKSHLVEVNKPYVFADTVKIRDRDTSVVKNYRFLLEGITRQPEHPDYVPQQGDLAVGATLRVVREDDDSTYIAQPMVILRGELVYYFPAQINELSTRVRLHPSIFDEVFTPEDQLQYDEFVLKQGQAVDFEGLKIQFEGFNPKAEHPALRREKGDLVVGARMTVAAPEGNTYKTEPIFFIRNNSPFNLKTEVEALGLHLRFISIDPNTETATLMLARKAPANPSVPLEVATNALRSDYIVMEAIEFPGINLFWLGTTLMMLGLGLSMGFRIHQLYRK
ncbi:MAG: cytochrome c biogenesis protein CcsA [Saprospiraceae bacterium]|nr:cytochrome c biogenesis protein CcsA [Saprospiraceae bacterium]